MTFHQVHLFHLQEVQESAFCSQLMLCEYQLPSSSHTSVSLESTQNCINTQEIKLNTAAQTMTGHIVFKHSGYKFPKKSVEKIYYNIQKHEEFTKTEI